MYCRKCGTEVPDGSTICSDCAKLMEGTADETPLQADKSDNDFSAKEPPPEKRRKGLGTNRLIAIAAAVIIAVGIFGTVSYASTRCAAADCNNTAEYGSYCARHVCMYPGCTSQRSSDSEYCYYHKSTAGDTSGYSSGNRNSGGSGYATTGKSNALSKAKSYLNSSAFSRKGLIEQLEYEGFSNDDATYAVDHCGADWNEQAVKKAKSYLRSSSFSRQRLIEQLEYEGFTHSQAEYGVKGAGYK